MSVLVVAALATAQPIALRGQNHAPSTERTRGGDDAADPGGDQRLDQGVDARRAVCPLPGEEVRAVFQFPENLVALEPPRDRGCDDLDQGLLVVDGVELADPGADLVDGVVVMGGNTANAQ
ncbi:MAG: hypothetical protein ACRDS0_39780 [Pseudonocardiaceae bacterium]